jgi:hypothetical protein
LDYTTTLWLGSLKRIVTGSDWEKGAAEVLLNTYAENVSRDRMLLRTVDNEVRAALSDRYRRLNSMRIFMAFLMGAHESGATLIDGHHADTRDFLEVIHPEVIEFDTENNGVNYAVFGSRIKNSDFGHGALELRSFMLNVRCLNGMVGETMLKEIHMGGSIPDTIEISEATVVKDTDARISLVNDAMKSMWSPRNTERMIEGIKGASSRIIDVKKETEKLPKMGLSQTEIDAFNTIMLNNRGDDGLQGDPTMWKFINGLTAVARDSEPERKRDLEEIAGKMLRF